MAPGAAPRPAHAVLLLLLSAACAERAGPAETHRRYLDALSAGDTEEAFGLLAGASRERLARAERSWRAGTPDPLLPGDPGSPRAEGLPPGGALFELLVGEGDPTGLPALPGEAGRLVEGARVEGGRARVQVATPHGTREAHLVLEEGGWRVLLPLE